MNPVYDFTGQVALVTGAAMGLGLATARAFSDAGAAVVLVDLNGDLAAEEARKIVTSGGRAIGLTCDVANEDQVAAAIDQSVKNYGRLDFAYNNAGIQVPPSDPADELVENFDRITSVNIRGVWACMKHELRVMRTQGSGAIVNCSSGGGLVGLPDQGSYDATKHAVIGLTKSAGLKYAARGIRVNAVCPGPMDTPMLSGLIEQDKDMIDEMVKVQPIGRIGRPEEVAAAVLWLCSPGASLVVGAALPVDGGFTAQ
ncbi:SDR family oxidoreductase [Sphingomonas sp. AP4-R1]|uniref:SDR family oxidoreductase n=1 Tax=Sphingomonas sp. AP4-R1 TaxID=2735134 RepID=UPI0014939F26|nr:SDR family oxidoreductase [Sphingomonas sp. AP4-R1]QJU58289.1 SDR family oxidoreductase [Sphingomonas sp. AP4-R1]